MKIKEILTAILQQMPGLSKPGMKFLFALSDTFLSLRGRYNFLNMSRWSCLNEKTLRRNYLKGFDFAACFRLFIDTIVKQGDCIAAIDASFIAKSGKKSFGLGKFWSGCLQKAVKGLEISTIVLIPINYRQAFTVSVRQTKESYQENENRVSYYLEQIAQIAPWLAKKTKYIVADGFYAKKRFFDGIENAKLFLITKLRSDADMRYLFHGPHPKARGRKQKYLGKVNWKATDILSHLWLEATLEDGLRIYSQILYSVSLKRDLKVVYIVNPKAKATALLACADTSLSAMNIYEYYGLRFQIEFTYRDAKQHLGLEHCQSTKEKSLDFHFNFSFLMLNLAKWQSITEGNKVFSIADIKTLYSNKTWLNLFISNLDLEPDLIINHPNFNLILNRGRIAA